MNEPALFYVLLVVSAGIIVVGALEYNDTTAKLLWRIPMVVLGLVVLTYAMRVLAA